MSIKRLDMIMRMMKAAGRLLPSPRAWTRVSEQECNRGGVGREGKG